MSYPMGRNAMQEAPAIGRPGPDAPGFRRTGAIR